VTLRLAVLSAVKRLERGWDGETMRALLNQLTILWLAGAWLAIFVMIAKNGGIFVIEPNKWVLYTEIILALGIVCCSLYSLLGLLRRLIFHK
jgi:Tfp pilus assembly protein PilZ